jgi:hypothetical protein
MCLHLIQVQFQQFIAYTFIPTFRLHFVEPVIIIVLLESSIKIVDAKSDL